MSFDAVLFDKDGTLFDFAGTWNRWSADVINDLSEGDQCRAASLADVLEFDLTRGVFLPHSFVVYATNSDVARAMAPLVPNHTQETLEHYLSERAGIAPLVETVPLKPFLQDLRSQKLALGVVTNDSEHSALSQLERAAVRDMFEYIAGFDSGFGSKPDPDPLLAFCRQTGIAPESCVMVGDSLHDLSAGRAAGMRCVGVLTGTAGRVELEPFADVVLQNIGEIPAWMAGE